MKTIAPDVENKISSNVSVIIPAKNEAESLKELLPRLLEHIDSSQVFIVNDGSSDDTESVLRSFGVETIRHQQSLGNGAAIKAGLRQVTTPIVVCMDADGQHDPACIKLLIERMEQGFDMVVGARGSESQASPARRIANGLYNVFASWVTNFPIADLTSGFRACNTEKFKQFLDLLPNGFSYPTTITMAFLRAGYTVGYEEISVSKRIGKSHIRLMQDGIRFLLIIFKIGTLFSPMKIFFPISVFLALLGFVYGGYTLVALDRFTNMGATLLTASIQVFLMGLISEQINMLQFSRGSRFKNSN